MDRFPGARAARYLPVLVLWSAGGKVYDPTLTEDADAALRPPQMSEPVTTSIPRSEVDEDAGPSGDVPDEVPLCGNGQLDPGERCDIGIEGGHAGACPNGCSGNTGCTERVLSGRGCAMRCDEREI